jgi:hypothetical protein
MNRQMNLQDNIFILNGRLRILRDTLALDADPELFFDRTVEDMHFMDHALDVLLGRVMDNRCIFDRGEVQDYLYDLEEDFSQLLGDVLDGGGSALSVPLVQERIRPLQARNAERRRVLGEERKSAAGPVIEHAVSSDELNELLKNL